MNWLKVGVKNYLNLDLVRGVTFFEDNGRHTLRFVYADIQMIGTNYIDITYPDKDKADAVYMKFLLVAGLLLDYQHDSRTDS